MGHHLREVVEVKAAPMAATPRAGPQQAPVCALQGGPRAPNFMLPVPGEHLLTLGFAVHYCLSLSAQFIQNDLPL